MIATLPGGIQLELLTQDELRDVLNEVVSGFLRPAETIIDENGLATDGSGNGTTSNWKVAGAGYEFALHRLVVDIDPGAAGYNVGNPFTAPNGYILIRRAGKLQEFFALSAAAGGIPAVYTASKDQAIRFKNNHPLNVQVVNGPPSTSLIFRIQGTLQPITTQ